LNYGLIAQDVEKEFPNLVVTINTPTEKDGSGKEENSLENFEAVITRDLFQFLFNL